MRLTSWSIRLVSPSATPLADRREAAVVRLDRPVVADFCGDLVAPDFARPFAPARPDPLLVFPDDPPELDDLSALKHEQAAASARLFEITPLDDDLDSVFRYLVERRS